MAETSDAGARQPFGLGSIISDTFKIFFGRIWTILILGTIPTTIGLLINGALFGFGAAMMDPSQLASGSFDPALIAGIVISSIINLVMISILTAMLVNLAYDAKLGRKRPISSYFGPAISVILPLVIMSIVAYLILAVGMGITFIPFALLGAALGPIGMILGAIAIVAWLLWFMGCFSALLPAIVIEKVGFGGLGRSARLTKDYRWPIAGTWVVLFIIVGVMSAILGAVTAVAAVAGGILVISLILTIIINSITYGFLSVATALIYARVREIKEGVGVDQIADVFD